MSPRSCFVSGWAVVGRTFRSAASLCRAAVVCGIAVCCFGETAYGQAHSKPYPTLGMIERKDPRFDKLVPADAKIEILASGFTWSEGPVWVKESGALLFSDIPRNSCSAGKRGKGSPCS